MRIETSRKALSALRKHASQQRVTLCVIERKETVWVPTAAIPSAQVIRQVLNVQERVGCTTMLIEEMVA